MKRQCGLSVPVFLALVLSSCHVYQGASIEGWIVDKQTQRPIEGAVVVALWDIYGGVGHQGTVGRLLTHEAVTDERGRFAFEPWGPKVVLWNALHGTSPPLVVFHKDYYFRVAGNDDPDDLRRSRALTVETRACTCNGERFELEKFDGDWGRYGQNAYQAELNLKVAPSREGFSCVWRDSPKATSELLRRGRQLKENEIFHSLPSWEELTSNARCDDLWATPGAPQ